MNCEQARSLFSSWLDTAVSGSEMQLLDQHIATCPACRVVYTQLQQSQKLLAAVGPRKAPPALSLRLRVLASQEAARRARRFRGLLVQFEHFMNSFMVPATAGLVSAVVIFGLLIGLYVVPGHLQAANDVPTTLYRPPELAAAPFGLSLNTASDDDFVVEAVIGPNGRVQDYRILVSPPESQHLLPELKNMLLFTTFRPATHFGRPTAGRAVISFSRVNVQG